MRTLASSVFVLLLAAPAFAQSYPSPTYNNTTTNNLTVKSLTGLVQANGTSPSTAISIGSGVGAALSQPVTGTGSIVLASSPTLTGTITTASGTASGQWSFGNLSGTSDGLPQILSGMVLNSYPGNNGTLGSGYFQMISGFSGGAPNDASAPAVGPVHGYQQIKPSVTYWNGLGGLFLTDNYSWIGQGSGVFGQGNSYNSGRVWGVLGEAKQLPYVGCVAAGCANTLTVGQTAISIPNGYAQGTESVSKNGSVLAISTDYTETGCSGSPSICTGITLVVALVANDVINVYQGNPQQGIIATELDVYGAPGVDTINQYTGNRVGLEVLGQRSDNNLFSTNATHIGSLIALGTASNVFADRGISFTGSGGIYNGAKGITFDNTQFTQAAIYSPGNLTNHQQIGIGDVSANFAIQIAGTTTTMPNGVGLELKENTGTTIDVRLFSSSGFATGNVGTFSNNDFVIWRNNTNVMRFQSTGPQFAVLPTSAGAGGLYVCADTSGNLYKKASCP